MNKEIQIFNNAEFGEVRTVQIDGEPWFVGRDVCKALGYSDIKAGTRKNVDDEDKRVCPVDTPSGEQRMTVINESGLYSLIFGSKLPSAKNFKKWVTSEVLPTLRKTGAYGKPVPMTIPEQIQLLAQGNIEIKKEIDNVKADLENFKNDMPILGVEESKITNAVKKKGVQCLGGKQSNAYQNASLRQKLYSDLHRQLKREFGVSTYKAIKRNQTDLALSIVNDYTPPMALEQEIINENSQQNLF